MNKSKKSAKKIYAEPSGSDIFQTVFEQSPVSTQVFAADGTLIRANKAWERLWGVTFEKVKGYNILKDKQLTALGIMPQIRKAFKGETVHFPPVKYAPNDTIPHVSKIPYRWTKSFIYPVKDAGGGIKEVVLVHEDITVQKTAEEQLYASEERYRSFIEQSSEGIWRFELEKPIAITVSAEKQIKLMFKYAYLAECNDSMAKMYGYKSASEITGARLRDFMIEDDKQNIAYLTAFIKSGYRLTNVESHEKDKKGHDKYFSNSLVGTVIDGNIIRAWGTQVDITNQKLAEDELKRSRDQLGIILEGVADGISVQDASGKLTYINDAGARASGYTSAKDMMSNHVKSHMREFEMVDEEGKPINFDQLPGRRALRGEKKPEAVIGYKDRKTGDSQWSIVKARPITDADGKVQLAINIFHDITKIRNAEKKAQNERNRWSNILESAYEGMFGMDNNLRCTFINPAALKLLGYTEKECLGKDVHKLFHYKRPDGKPYPAKECPIHKAIQKGKPIRIIEETLWQKDGLPITVIYSCSPIVEEGKVAGAVVSIVDIREQKEAERKILESENRFRTFTDFAPVGIFQTGADGNCLFVNKRWCEMAGMSVEEALGQGWTNALHPEDKERVFKEWYEVTKNKTEFSSIYRFRTPSGKVTWLQGNAIELSSNSGEIFGYLGTVMDITERKNIERQKDEFIAVASHELKTPVTSLKVYAQVLHKQFSNSGDMKSALLIGKMDTQFNKLTHLISDLLDVTKIETGKLQLHEEWFDFNELVNEVVEEMQRTTEKHTIAMEFDKTRSVYGDRDRISQVIVNFISNAIKYSPQSDAIVVKTKASRISIGVSVQDFGVGISKEAQGQIFERFYRAEGTQEITFPGLGLGLYISSEIIKRHNGTIWVESKPKKGSTFHFSLPLK